MGHLECDVRERSRHRLRQGGANAGDALDRLRPGRSRRQSTGVRRRGESDLATLYRRLAEQGELCGYEVTERFYEIGTAESLAETERFLRTVRSRVP